MMPKIPDRKNVPKKSKKLYAKYKICKFGEFTFFQT